MPVFDFVSLAKSFARILFLTGLIAFALGLTNMLGDVFIHLWTFINGGVDKLQDAFNGGSPLSSSQISCLFNYIHLLGMDVVFTSFFVTVWGIVSAWVGFNLYFTGYSYALRISHYVLLALK